MFDVFDMAVASGLPPEPPHAIKKADAQASPRERDEKSPGKSAANFFTMSRPAQKIINISI
jgi:hypothetical protein